MVFVLPTMAGTNNKRTILSWLSGVRQRTGGEDQGGETDLFRRKERKGSGEIYSKVNHTNIGDALSPAPRPRTLSSSDTLKREHSFLEQLWRSRT